MLVFDLNCVLPVMYILY